MIYIALEQYCKDKLDCQAMDLLGLKRSQWFEIKQNGDLPLKHCKTICNHFGKHITDDMKELTDIITKAYYTEVIV